MHRCSKRIFFLCPYEPGLGFCMEHIDRRVYSPLCQHATQFYLLKTRTKINPKNKKFSKTI
jgi:hypothetical protein